MRGVSMIKSRWLMLGETGSGFVVESERKSLEENYWIERGRAEKLKKELDQWKCWSQIGLIAVGLFLLAKCEGTKLDVKHDSSTLNVEHWRWWGLSRTQTPIVWRENQWMWKNDKGEWETAVDPPEP